MINNKNIMQPFHGWMYFLLILSITSCTESITIDPPEEIVLPVVEGYITDEFKQHEITLSYSSKLYAHNTEMISDAEVFVRSGHDTIWYHEQPDNPGHYLSDSVAGVKRRWYHLDVTVKKNKLYNRPLRIIASSYMPNNVDQIDSLALLPLRNEEGIPFVDDEAAVCVCPYFQALPDSNIVYNVELFLNGKPFKNRPSKIFNLFAMRGYTGYYFNGPEMLQNNVEIPVGIMNKSYLKEGDVVKLRLVSITQDYMYFLISQKLAVGSNPVMGAFPSNLTNLSSDCNAIGWFSTTSVVEIEGVYHDWE